MFILYETEKGNRLEEFNGNGEVRITGLLHGENIPLWIFNDAAQALEHILWKANLAEESITIENEIIVKNEKKMASQAREIASLKKRIAELEARSHKSSKGRNGHAK